MIADNHKISIRQFQILTILNVLGTSLMLLPKTVGLLAMEDSYISIIIGTIFGLCSMFLICLCVKKQPYKNFYTLNKNIFGKQLGFVISLMLMFTIITITGMNVKIFGEVFVDVMLPTTPTPIVTISLLLISGYGASKGIEARGRLGEIIIYFVFLFIVLSLFFVVGNFDYRNFLPILKNSYIDTVKGSMIVFFGLSGIIYTYLAYPHIEHKKKFIKSSMSTIVTLGFIMLVIVIVTQGTFGIKSVNYMKWPLLELISSVETSGSFVERQDALVISFWIFIVFASVNAGIYYTSYLLWSFKPNIKFSHYIFLSSLLIFAESIFSFGDRFIIYLLVFFMVAFPLFIALSVKKVGVNVFVVAILLSQISCSDKISLENRSFPLTIGIDKVDNEFHLTYSIPISIKPNESEKVMTTSSGTTLELAIKNMEKNSAKFIDYRHTKTIILGNDFLKDKDMMKEVFTKINNSPLNNKTMILGTDLASIEIIESQEKTNNILGEYITSYFKNNSSLYNMELFEVSEKIQDCVVIIPKISINDNDEILLQDGVILKDYELVDILQDKYTTAYATFMGIGDGLTLDNGGRIISNKTNFDFRLVGTTLVVNANVNVVADQPYDSLANEINGLWNYFYNDLSIDGFNIYDTLRKDNYYLYENRDLIENLELDVNLDYKLK